MTPETLEAQYREQLLEQGVEPEKAKPMIETECEEKATLLGSMVALLNQQRWG